MDISPQAKAVQQTGKVKNLKAFLDLTVNTGKNAAILKSVVCSEKMPVWAEEVSPQFWAKVAALDAKKLNLFLADDSLVALKAAITRMHTNRLIDQELSLVGLVGYTLSGFNVVGLHKKVIMPNEFYFGQMPIWAELEAEALKKRTKMTEEQAELCRGLAITGIVVEKVYPLIQPEEVTEEVAAVV